MMLMLSRGCQWKGILAAPAVMKETWLNPWPLRNQGVALPTERARLIESGKYSEFNSCLYDRDDITLSMLCELCKECLWNWWKLYQLLIGSTQVILRSDCPKSSIFLISNDQNSFSLLLREKLNPILIKNHLIRCKTIKQTYLSRRNMFTDKKRRDTYRCVQKLTQHYIYNTMARWIIKPSKQVFSHTRLFSIKPSL